MLEELWDLTLLLLRYILSLVHLFVNLAMMGGGFRPDLDGSL